MHQVRFKINVECIFCHVHKSITCYSSTCKIVNLYFYDVSTTCSHRKVTLLNRQIPEILVDTLSETQMKVDDMQLECCYTLNGITYSIVHNSRDNCDIITATDWQMDTLMRV